MTSVKISLWCCGVLFLAACKQVTTTNAPGAGQQGAASSDSKKAANQVVGTTEVSLDQVPQLTVTVDLSACIGPGRWYSPTNTSDAVIGAVSLTPTRTQNDDLQQPIPWVFDPAINKAGDAVETKASYKWRIESGDYKIDAVAYDVSRPEKQVSMVTKSFDFKSSNDVKLEVVGSWANNQCNLSWK